MSEANRCGRNRAVYTFLAVGIAAAFCVLYASQEKRPGPDSRSRYPLRKPTGYPQLVSVQPLPDAAIEGEMCEWVPASSPVALAAVLRQERTAARAASPSSAESRTSIALERPPVRMIRDPYPAYSAVAVDIKNNEIILQDENLFQIQVYDRLANTPPSASMTEPKRVITGLQTNVEFNCGLYVDPKNGDIYSVNNDALEWTTVFSRDKRGNVRPDRQLHTPLQTYGIAVDEASEELFFTNQGRMSVLVYPKYAKGEDKPIRVIRGNRTGLADPHGIGLDTKNGWIFVANYGSTATLLEGAGNAQPRGGKVAGSGRYELPSVTVYPIKANGDIPPLRTIQGSNTMLNWPAHLYVDEEHGEVFVASDADQSVLVFRVTDNGNVAPTRVLKGPKTQIKNPTGIFVDTVHNELVVANMGNHTATVYSRTAEGDTPPLRMIRSGPPGKAALKLGNPGSVAYDTKRDAILVPN